MDKIKNTLAEKRESADTELLIRENKEKVISQL